VSRARYIYGRHPVAELLRGRPRDVQRIFLAGGARPGRLGDIEGLAAHHEVPVVSVSKRRLDDLVGSVPHQGVVAAVQPFAYADLDALLARARELGEPPLVVALDQIQDPHNLGALLRSAYALGAHGVFIPKDRAVEVTPVVMKRAAGATAHLPVARVTNLRRSIGELKDAGLWVMGAAAEGDEVLDEVDLTGPTVLVIGSEGGGLRRSVAQACDRLVRIPMHGKLGSLNASVAGALFLYEANRQRRRAVGASCKA
jgi:23S rRNA (guanosine2251-2'-O)-methyltransferase